MPPTGAIETILTGQTPDGGTFYGYRVVTRWEDTHTQTIITYADGTPYSESELLWEYLSEYTERRVGDRKQALGNHHEVLRLLIG